MVVRNDYSLADKAIDQLNFEPIKGEKPMRITWAQRDPTLQKFGVKNICVKGLDKCIDGKALRETFGAFGKILFSRVSSALVSTDNVLASLT